MITAQTVPLWMTTDPGSSPGSSPGTASAEPRPKLHKASRRTEDEVYELLSEMSDYLREAGEASAKEIAAAMGLSRMYVYTLLKRHRGIWFAPGRRRSRVNGPGNSEQLWRIPTDAEWEEAVGR
jgi:hypothetical protein